MNHLCNHPVSTCHPDCQRIDASAQLTVFDSGDRAKDRGVEFGQALAIREAHGKVWIRQGSFAQSEDIGALVDDILEAIHLVQAPVGDDCPIGRITTRQLD
jgi:hypothetical protein